jgi:glycerol-3-phosphate dehydrogenase
VDTALSVHQLSECEDLQLPIMNEVYNMLFQDKDPGEVVSTLLSRTPYEEWKAFDLSSFQEKLPEKK